METTAFFGRLALSLGIDGLSRSEEVTALVRRARAGEEANAIATETPASLLVPRLVRALAGAGAAAALVKRDDLPEPARAALKGWILRSVHAALLEGDWSAATADLRVVADLDAKYRVLSHLDAWDLADSIREAYRTHEASGTGRALLALQALRLKSLSGRDVRVFWRECFQNGYGDLAMIMVAAHPAAPLDVLQDVFSWRNVAQVREAVAKNPRALAYPEIRTLLLDAQPCVVVPAAIVEGGERGREALRNAMQRSSLETLKVLGESTGSVPLTETDLADCLVSEDQEVRLAAMLVLSRLRPEAREVSQGGARRPAR